MLTSKSARLTRPATIADRSRELSSVALRVASYAPAEVVMRDAQGHAGAKVLDLLAGGVHQPGEPTQAHPHRQILPLEETR